MIFTGVTGGEIVSLLYPLFILNAFCYIIISKESLDGASSFFYRDGSISVFKKTDRLLFGRRCGRNDVSASLCYDDRSDSVGASGAGYVFDTGGG